MEARTHLAIDRELCGTPLGLSVGAAEVELVTTARMAADASSLVHGGFVFGLADHAAMLAVNEPNVVLGSAQVRFVAPVRVGETLRARASVRESAGKKRIVEVAVVRGADTVATAELVCLVPDRHVLDPGAGDARR